MAKEMKTHPVNRNMTTLDHVADLVAKNGDPDTFMPVWSKYISDLAANNMDEEDVQHLIMVIGTRALVPFLEQMARDTIPETNEDKKYYLMKLAIFNKISESIAQVLKEYNWNSTEIQSASPLEKLPFNLRMLQGAALAVIQAGKTAPGSSGK